MENCIIKVILEYCYSKVDIIFAYCDYVIYIIAYCSNRVDNTIYGSYKITVRVAQQLSIWKVN